MNRDLMPHRDAQDAHIEVNRVSPEAAMKEMSNDLVDMKALEMGLESGTESNVDANVRLSDYREKFRQFKERHGSAAEMTDVFRHYEEAMTRLNLAVFQAHPDMEVLERSDSAADYLSDVLKDFESGDMDTETASAYVEVHMEELDALRDRMRTDTSFAKAFVKHAEVITALATAVHEKSQEEARSNSDFLDGALADFEAGALSAEQATQYVEEHMLHLDELRDLYGDNETSKAYGGSITALATAVRKAA
jgi:hypothetical protein